MFFYIDSNYKIWGRVNHFHFKRGDDLELTLIFIGKKGYTITPEFLDIVFAAKLPGNYSGEFMAYTNTFIPAKTAEGDPCMRGTLRLNSVELSSKMGKDDSIELEAEFEFNKQGEKLSSQTVRLFIHNDLIKGMEGIPSGIMPDYVTKSYVDATVSGNVTQAFEKKAQELSSLREDSSRFKEAAEKALSLAQASTAESSVNAGLARNKAEEARKSEESAFSYKSEASSSALSAVRSARDAADSASGIIRFVERAENSATLADNCSQTVQHIQQSIEGQAGEIQENCLSAKSSALAAQESSTQARSSAQSVESGVFIVQTAQAKVEQVESRIFTSESRVAAHVLESERLASAAEASERNASTASLASGNSAQSATQEALRAEGFASNASLSAQAASRSEVSATSKAKEAGQSAVTAQTAAENISLDWQEINQSLNLAQQSATSASSKASEALVSAGKAKTSEDNARNAESNAVTSKLAAAASAAESASNASIASEKASLAQASATAALASATTAADSAGTATEKAEAAAGYSVAAAGSASDSAGSAASALTAQRAAESARESAESAALRAEIAAEDSITQGEVDTTLSQHNAQDAAHSSQFARKLDMPEGGVAGQILTKTATGTIWGDAPEGGGSFDPVDSYTFTGDNTFTGGVTISSVSANKPALKITAPDNVSLTVKEGDESLDFLVDGSLEINSAAIPLKKAGTLGINVPLTLSDSLIINNSEKTKLVSSSTQIIMGGSNGEVNRLDFSVSRNTSLDFSVYGEIRGPNNTMIAGLRMLPRSLDVENKGFSWGWTGDKYSLVNMAMLNYLTIKKPYLDGESGQFFVMGESQPEWIDLPNTAKIYHIRGIVDDLIDKDVPDGLYKVTLMMKKNSALYPVLLGEAEVYGANCLGICETGVYYNFTDLAYGSWMNSLGDNSVQPTEFDYISGTFFWKKTVPGILGLADYGGDSDIIVYLEYIREDFLVV